MPPARKHATPWILPALILAAATLLLLVPLPRRFDSGWRAQLLDFGHVPLFALLTLALWPVCRKRWCLTALFTLALAALVEVVQTFVGRSGDVPDFLRGAAGILAMASLLRAMEGRRTWPRLTLHGLVALCLFAIPAVEVGPTLVDAAEGFADFPTLADFTVSRRLERWECVQSELRRVEITDRVPPQAGRVEFLTGPAPYPAIILRHVLHDFTGYRRLCWSFTVEGEPLRLVFSLRGGPDASGKSSHYQFERVFGPGDHVVQMDLREAMLLAWPGPLNLDDLWWSQLFVYRADHSRVIYLWRVWLE